MTELQSIAQQMTQKGKGILAADESTPTCGKRFESIKVESTFENRNEYRDLLITAKGMEKYIGGVIMFDETLKQSTTCSEKILFPEHKNLQTLSVPSLRKVLPWFLKQDGVMWPEIDFVWYASSILAKYFELYV